MSLLIEFKNNERYLFSKIGGEWTKENTYKMLDEIKIEADKKGFKLILINAIDLSLPDNEMTRYFTGEKIASTFLSYKIAICMRTERINKFAENVAVNRGATMLVCDTEKEGIDWLLS